MGEPYGLIDWYTELQTFEDFKGDKRSELLDSSSEEFFKKMKDYASGKAKGKKVDSINDLSYDDWKSEIASKTNIENDAKKWFDNKLYDKIDESDLRTSTERQLKRNISTYESEDDLDKAIKEDKEFIESEFNSLRIEFENLEVSTDTSNDFRQIKNRANNLPDSSEKRQLIEDIISDEIGLRELEYIEENKTKWRDIIRYDRGTPEEIQEATENLRKLNAQSLGQVKMLKGKDIEKSAMAKFFRNE